MVNEFEIDLCSAVHESAPAPKTGQKVAPQQPEMGQKVAIPGGANPGGGAHELP
jgi:hypothetical protein